jgi:hypothetical protein
VIKTLYYKRVEEVETFLRFPIPLVRGNPVENPESLLELGLRLSS